MSNLNKWDFWYKDLEETINMFNPKSIRYETYNTDTVYKQEIVVYIEK